MKFLMAVLLVLGVIGSSFASDVARLTTDEVQTEFDAGFVNANFCLANIKLGNDNPIHEDTIKRAIINAVDIRCANTFIHLYNLSRTPNQLEDFVGQDAEKQKKVELMREALNIFYDLYTGLKKKYPNVVIFENFEKTLDKISHPRSDAI